MKILNYNSTTFFLFIFLITNSVFSQNKPIKEISSDIKFVPTYKISKLNMFDNSNSNDARLVTEICGEWINYFEFEQPENDFSNDTLTNLVSDYKDFDEKILNVTWKDVYQLNIPSKNKFIKGELPNGNWTFTYPNGTIRAVGKFNYGRPEGEWIYYDNLGKIEATENYTNGLPDGIWKFKNGRIQSFKNGFANGKWYPQKEQNERIILNYVDGKIEGEQIFSLNGFDMCKFNYKNDRLNGEIIVYSLLNQQEIRLKGNFVNDVPDGEWNYYSISEYHKEEKESLVRCYYTERYPKSITNHIYKKVIYSKDKISEYEIFDGNSELKLVSELFLKYNKLNFNYNRLPYKIELKTCVDSIEQNGFSEFIYPVVKKVENEDSDETEYCLANKKIKYYKNGKIQYIGYYPENYAKENNPQYFSIEGNIIANCTFNNGNWIFKNSDGNEFFESDEFFGFFDRYYMGENGEINQVEKSIKRD